MDATTSVEVLKTGASLIQAFIWPAVVLFVVLYFGQQLKNFLRDAHELTFKAGTSGIEATAKRQQIEAAVALTTAAVQRQLTAPRTAKDEAVQSQLEVPPSAEEIANVVNEATRPQAARRLAGASVLWVDDRPTNNTYERRTLEAFGLAITLSTSTEEGLEKLRARRFDVVITDLGRPGDPQAGYTLLEHIRQTNKQMPVIIYSAAARDEQHAEARRRGAFGSTNNPQELIQLVVSAVLGRS